MTRVSAFALLLLAGCIPTSIPSAPPPSLDAVADELGVPGVRTLRLREGTFDGIECSLRIYDAAPDGLRFAAVEFPGARDAGLTVVAPGDAVVRVGDTLQVEVEGTACAPRLRYGTRPVEGAGRVQILADEDGELTGALVADLRPVGGAAARAGRSVRVLGTFRLSTPDETVSE